MTYLARAKKVFDLELGAVRQVRNRIGPEFSKAIDLLMACVSANHKIIVSGVGKSGHIGHKIAATLTSTGAPAVILDASDAVHGDLGLLGRGDVVILLSYSGQSDELIQLVPHIRRFGNKIIALTGNPRSPVATLADVHLNIAVSKEACPLNLAPTSSTTAMLVMGDALAMVLLEARGFKREDFANFHPGGAIGRNLLLTAASVMRPLSQVAVCRVTDPVDTALNEISAKRCGAVIVQTVRGKLAGVFTHGDFARSYQANRSIGKTPLHKVMTRQPISVRADQLVAEVLNIFEKNRIEDLIVVDANAKPIGLIDIQDLTRHRII
ncbi:MAG: KpsF/GutQ family sugar-phosphate isomerase [Candidatus Methylacidiphilales bacterium]